MRRIIVAFLLIAGWVVADDADIAIAARDVLEERIELGGVRMVQ